MGQEKKCNSRQIYTEYNYMQELIKNAAKGIVLKESKQSTKLDETPYSVLEIKQCGRRNREKDNGDKEENFVKKQRNEGKLST